MWTRSRRTIAWMAPGLLMACVASPACATVRIDIDLGTQSMHVASGSGETHDWRISSGREGLETPTGTFGVTWMDETHRSKEFHDSPMPNAIFFRDGKAIHGTYESIAGTADSHGCVRMRIPDSKVLFKMVKREGAKIVISGVPPTREAAGRGRGHRDEGTEGTMPTFADQQSDVIPTRRVRGGYDDVQFGPADDPAPRRRRSEVDAQRSYDFGD